MPVAYHRYPAAVTSSEGWTERRTALVVIDGTAELVVQPKTGVFDPAQPLQHIELADVTVGEDRYQLPSGQERVRTLLTAANGVTWTVEEGDGCGCRSPLRDFYQARLRGQPMGT